jgi:hypothetical protein
MADGADWWAFYIDALSGMLLIVYQVCAAKNMTLFFSPEETLALFQNELLMSFWIMSFLIN